MQNIIHALLSNDLKTFVESIGLFGVYLVVFAESGLLVGFFLPGDSLLFTAGLLASSGFGFFGIWPLLLGSWFAAILGDNVGYEFGKRMGPALFRRKESILFHPDNLLKAQKFYDTYGGKAITLARFMPVIRTFAPMVAGIGKMDHKKFTFFNFVGGTIWVWGMVFGGYFLGNLIPNVDHYLLPIVGLIVVLSVLPPAIHLYKDNKDAIHKKIRNTLKIK